MRKLFLYGPPGSGKSTVGKCLAENLGFVFIDLDEQIERTAGESIADIMAASGENTFRDMETRAILQVCQYSTGEGCVVALGGGALLRPENRAAVEAAGIVVFLEQDLESLLGRIPSNETKRPLLAGNPSQKLMALLDARKEHYASFELRVAIEGTTAELRSDTHQVEKSPQAMAWEVQRLVGWYHVRGMGQGYDVIVQPGGLEALGNSLLERGLGDPIVVVSDENIAPLYGQAALNAIRSAGYEARLLVIRAGEDFKTLETVAGLWKGFLAAGMDRKSTVIALGGGVVGDLAGFAAATFMRGCNWVAVPTSLLSMVDASMGGKTGFDLPEGKNLVGAFHPPSLVLADPAVLSSLPEAELRSGLAEVVKHGIIADKSLFELCEKGSEAVLNDLPRVVRRAMAVKAQIIEQDPFEKGVRAALNLGHTVGHAVEIVSEFGLRHGEAVAIGTVVEARLAERLGLAPVGLSMRIAETMTGLGLPVSVPSELPVGAIISRMRFDKKKTNKVVNFALPLQIGQVEPSVPVNDLEKVFSREFLFASPS